MPRNEESRMAKDEVWLRIEEHVGPLVSVPRRRDWRTNLDDTLSIFVTFSKYHSGHDWYWYGIRHEDLENWLAYDSSFVVFILGEADQVLVIPVEILKYHIDKENVSHQEDKHSYKINIMEEDLRIVQLPNLDAMLYLNDYSRFSFSPTSS